MSKGILFLELELEKNPFPKKWKTICQSYQMAYIGTGNGTRLDSMNSDNAAEGKIQEEPDIERNLVPVQWVNTGSELNRDGNKWM